MQLYDPCTTMFFFRNKVRHICREVVLLPLVKLALHVKDHANEQSMQLFLKSTCIMMLAVRLQHIMIDLGTGNNNKVNWAMTDKQEFIDIVEVVYRGARKGRGLVVSCGTISCCQCLKQSLWHLRSDASLSHAGITQRLLHKVPVLRTSELFVGCSCRAQFLWVRTAALYACLRTPQL